MRTTQISLQLCWGVDGPATARFWQKLHSLGEPFSQLAGHPVFQGADAADWGRIVPLAIHEDAGPFSKRSSVNIISFCGLFTRAGDRQSQFPIATYIKEGPLSGDSLQSFWGPILDEFQSLASRPVGGYRFFVSFL